MPDAVARRRHAVAGERPPTSSDRAPRTRAAARGRRATKGRGGSCRGPRGVRGVLPAAAAAAALWLAAAAPLAGQGSHAQVYLTVLDRDGAPIVDLQPRDVVVRENGVPGEVLHLVRPRTPADVALLVDASRDFVSATHHLRRGLRTFVDRLAGRARTSLMIFDTGARNVVAPTLRAAPLRAAIDALFPSPGFHVGVFHDAVMQTARSIAERRPRRPIIVAVTSSAASRSPSRRYVRDFLDPLVSVGTPVHLVVLRRGPGDLRGGLAEIAARTAGRFAVVANQTRLEEPLAAIADEILAQYVLTYARPELPDDAADVVLGFQVAREDVTIRVAPVF